MSCSKQHSPAVFLKFIKETTGVDITQSEWHEIKQLAKAAGYDVSKTRADQNDADWMLGQLKTSLRNDPLLKCDETFLENSEQDAKEMLFDLDGSLYNVTTRGTIGTVDYMTTRGGVSKIVQEIRGRTSATKKGVDTQVESRAAAKSLYATMTVNEREIAARSPRTSAALLFVLAQDRDPNTRLAVAENLCTDRETLKMLAESQDSDARLTVACNPNADAEILAGLARGKYPDIRAAVAENQNVSSETLNSLAGDASASVRRVVARSEKATPESLAELAEDELDSIRESVAENRNTAPETLAYLAEDGKTRIRVLVAKNPNTPANVVKYLGRALNL